jgi:hypothetical protein
MATAQPIPARGSSYANSASANGVEPGSSTLHLTNQCLHSKSLYIRSHANNQVKWQLWGDEAFALAKKSNRLIFLSIGYATSHCMSA